MAKQLQETYLDLADRLKVFVDTCVDTGKQIPASNKLAEKWGVSKFQMQMAVVHLSALGILYRKGYRLYGTKQQSAYNAEASAYAPWRVKILHTNLTEMELYKSGYESMSKFLNMDCDSECVSFHANMEKLLYQARADKFHAVAVMPPLSGSLSIISQELFSLLPIISAYQSKSLYQVVDTLGPLLNRAKEYLLSSNYNILVSRVDSNKVTLWRKESENWVNIVLDKAFPVGQDLPDLLDTILNNYAPPIALVGPFKKSEFQQIISILKKRKWRIPEDFGCCCLGEPYLNSEIPGFKPTTVAYNPYTQGEYMALLTLTLLQFQKKHSQFPPPPTSISLPITLSLGNTTNIVSRGIQSNESGITVPKGQNAYLWQHYAEYNNTLYPLTRQVPYQAFKQFDLCPWTNRSYAKNNGWFGDLSLRYLRAGLILIHGIPFSIIDETSNESKGALVLYCARHRTKGSRLPEQSSLSFNRTARALYFLHACGYAHKQQEFACYKLYTGPHVHTIPLISTKNFETNYIEHLNDYHLCPQECTISDWYLPDMVLTHPAAKSWFLYNRNESSDKAFTLCVYEWINPNPEIEIDRIEIQMNPEAESTYALLGLTWVEV